MKATRINLCTNIPKRYGDILVNDKNGERLYIYFGLSISIVYVTSIRTFYLLQIQMFLCHGSSK